MLSWLSHATVPGFLFCISLFFNKESRGNVQSDAADGHTDLHIDNSHTYTAQTALLADCITVILTMVVAMVIYLSVCERLFSFPFLLYHSVDSRT